MNYFEHPFKHLLDKKRTQILQRPFYIASGDVGRLDKPYHVNHACSLSGACVQINAVSKRPKFNV